MYKRILPIFCALAILLVVAPARAAERIDPSQRPAQGPLSSERSLEVFVVNGRPVAVARTEYLYGESDETSRLHSVWHDLDAAGGIVAVFEYILIGAYTSGVLYERRNNEHRWKAGRPGEAGAPSARDFEEFFSKWPPAEWPGDFIHTDVGNADVNGVQTRQFQAQLQPEKLPSGVRLFKDDSFYTKQPWNGVENYLIKNQFTLGLTNATGGTDLLEYVIAWYDPNVPLTIGEPPAELVDIVGAQALTGRSFGSQALRARIRAYPIR